MSQAQPPLTEIPADQCWELLATHRPALGRVAFTVDGATVIYPMNYAVAHRRVYVRTDPASRLATITQALQVAFEVDDVDAAWEQGWSVMVQGRLHDVVDPDELERHRELRLRTWAPGKRLHLLRLDPEHVSGRRIGS